MADDTPAGDPQPDLQKSSQDIAKDISAILQQYPKVEMAAGKLVEYEHHLVDQAEKINGGSGAGYQQRFQSGLNISESDAAKANNRNGIISILATRKATSSYDGEFHLSNWFTNSTTQITEARTEFVETYDQRSLEQVEASIADHLKINALGPERAAQFKKDLSEITPSKLKLLDQGLSDLDQLHFTKEDKAKNIKGDTPDQWARSYQSIVTKARTQARLYTSDDSSSLESGMVVSDPQSDLLDTALTKAAKGMQLKVDDYAGAALVKGIVFSGDPQANPKHYLSFNDTAPTLTIAPPTNTTTQTTHLPPTLAQSSPPPVTTQLRTTAAPAQHAHHKAVNIDDATVSDAEKVDAASKGDLWFDTGKAKVSQAEIDAFTKFQEGLFTKRAEELGATKDNKVTVKADFVGATDGTGPSDPKAFHNINHHLATERAALVEKITKQVAARHHIIIESSKKPTLKISPPGPSDHTKRAAHAEIGDSVAPDANLTTTQTYDPATTAALNQLDSSGRYRLTVTTPEDVPNASKVLSNLSIAPNALKDFKDVHLMITPDKASSAGGQKAYSIHYMSAGNEIGHIDGFTRNQLATAICDSVNADPSERTVKGGPTDKLAHQILAANQVGATNARQFGVLRDLSTTRESILPLDNGAELTFKAQQTAAPMAATTYSVSLSAPGANGEYVTTELKGIVSKQQIANLANAKTVEEVNALTQSPDKAPTLLNTPDSATTTLTETQRVSAKIDEVLRNSAPQDKAQDIVQLGKDQWQKAVIKGQSGPEASSQFSQVLDAKINALYASKGNGTTYTATDVDNMKSMISAAHAYNGYNGPTLFQQHNATPATQAKADVTFAYKFDKRDPSSAPLAANDDPTQTVFGSGNINPHITSGPISNAERALNEKSQNLVTSLAAKPDGVAFHVPGSMNQVLVLKQEGENSYSLGRYTRDDKDPNQATQIKVIQGLDQKAATDAAKAIFTSPETRTNLAKDVESKGTPLNSMTDKLTASNVANVAAVRSQVGLNMRLS